MSVKAETIKPIYVNGGNEAVDLSQVGKIYPVKKITPEDCARLLADNNFFNRKISMKKVNTYSDRMEKGEWNCGLVEGLMFHADQYGNLLSAQHRLMAAVESDFTFEDVYFTINDREMWLEKTQESRTRKDRNYMENKNEISDELIEIVSSMEAHHLTLTNVSPFLAPKKKGARVTSGEAFEEIKETLIPFYEGGIKDCGEEVFLRKKIAVCMMIMARAITDIDDALVLLGDRLLDEYISKNDSILKITQRVYYYYSTGGDTNFPVFRIDSKINLHQPKPKKKKVINDD